MQDLTLTDQETKDLRMDKKTGGLYCQQCDACLAQCPQQLPIPESMRSYMYAYGIKTMRRPTPWSHLWGCLKFPVEIAVSVPSAVPRPLMSKDRVTDIVRMKGIIRRLFLLA